MALNFLHGLVWFFFFCFQELHTEVKVAVEAILNKYPDIDKVQIVERPGE